MASTFFALPSAVRDKIYHYAFLDQTYQSLENGLLVYYSYALNSSSVYWDDSPSFPLWITASKQLHAEALVQFYRVAECYHFHVANPRARLVVFSPFTIGRVRVFNLGFRLRIWNHGEGDGGGGEDGKGVHGFVEVDSRDEFECVFLESRKAMREHDGGEAEMIRREKLGLEVITKSLAGDVLKEEQERQLDKQSKEIEAHDAGDEGCRRFAEILTRRKANDVTTLYLHLEFPDDRASELQSGSAVLETWHLQLSFLETLGTCLEKVSFSMGGSCTGRYEAAVQYRHLVIILLQHEFERIGKELVSGIDINGKKGDWVLRAGEDGSVMVDRGETGEMTGRIEYRGLDGFYDDSSGIDYYYHKLPDSGDGRLRWFNECKNDTVIVSALATMRVQGHVFTSRRLVDDLPRSQRDRGCLCM